MFEAIAFLLMSLVGTTADWITTAIESKKQADAITKFRFEKLNLIQNIMKSRDSAQDKFQKLQDQYSQMKNYFDTVLTSAAPAYLTKYQAAISKIDAKFRTAREKVNNLNNRLDAINNVVEPLPGSDVSSVISTWNSIKANDNMLKGIAKGSPLTKLSNSIPFSKLDSSMSRNGDRDQREKLSSTSTYYTNYRKEK